MFTRWLRLRSQIAEFFHWFDGAGYRFLVPIVGKSGVSPSSFPEDELFDEWEDS